jgi:CubicO group peptidase (beta-lactamase class C family)
MRYRIFSWAVVLCCLAGKGRGQKTISQPDIVGFVEGLNNVKSLLRIPAMEAAVMQGDSILLEKGFGVPADAIFRVASITKTFTSTLIMQLVEKGKLDLDAPISRYGLDLGNPVITVRQLLTHTSEEKPGTWFSYSGYRFGRLGVVIEKAAGVPYYQLLMENIVKPLHLYSTAPGDSLNHYSDYIRRYPEMARYFKAAHSRLVTPYAYDSLGQPVKAVYLDEFGAFGGLATTAGDLLKYSAAIDRHLFVSAATQQQIFTPNRTTSGIVTPYGLGWFVENYQGIDIYWHYGQTSPGESGLFVKVPAKKLTVVVLANTDKLSTPFPMGDGDLLMSPVGILIYFELLRPDIDILHPKPEDRDLRNKAEITSANVKLVHGDTAEAAGLYEDYWKENFEGKPAVPPAGDILAAIKNVPIKKDTGRSFTLAAATTLRVYGVGEDCSGDHLSWCDYGWIEDSAGTVVWQMPGQPVQPAGGAAKNQRVDAVIELPAGSYKLRYKSDWGHAYGNWDSLPPDQFFWGVVVYKQ